MKQHVGMNEALITEMIRFSELPNCLAVCYLQSNDSLQRHSLQLQLDAIHNSCK